MESARALRQEDLPQCERLLRMARLDNELMTHDASFVGTFETVVCGIAVGHSVTDLGVVDLIFVEPEARGVGVGTALAEALLEWFIARGCNAVDAIALPGDRDTKRLYEAMGFTARLLVLHRHLP